MINIFTEAGSKQGFGHLSRCCALYDESVALGYDTRLIVNTSDSLPEMQRNIFVADWLDLSVLMPLLKNSDRVVIDSYLADLYIYETIASNCFTLLYIDDYMRIDYPKGIVINPSLYGDKMPYRSRNDVKYLGGSQHVIVRPEFQNITPIYRSNERNKILITMGGSDILNLTPTILNALSKQLPSAQKFVVVGSGFSRTCNREIELTADNNTKLYYSLTASQMCDLMLNVDIAITAAGQTIYELMSCGVPMIPIKVVDNQKWNVIGLKEQGIMCLDATDIQFNAALIEWKDLIKNALVYSPFSFCGQKNILKILTGE